ncbi:MAG TPA: hypothetical protein VKV26_05320 [Dehalococcoidia bacterium]|nr:hypothetical protein [Dehalococcoidia bacterium]
MGMQAEERSARAASDPRRIYILGGPGSGKSTLARQLGRRLRLPVHELDAIAFVDFHASHGLGQRRPLADCIAAVEAISGQPGWISEGFPARWTDPLLAASDLVIWLDVPWHLAFRRVLRRYLHAVRTDPLPPSVRRWQLRSIARGLFVALSPVGGSLALRLPAARRGLRLLGWWYSYSRGKEWTPLDVEDAGRVYSRAATTAHLRPYATKLIRLRRPLPAGDLLERWRLRTAGLPAGVRGNEHGSRPSGMLRAEQIGS